MEYTQKSPIELSKYIEDYHTSVKKEFEIVLTDIYNNEINKYSDIIEHIVRLPFVQAIVEENKRLKEQVTKLQQNLDVDNNETTHVVLEISDKPVTQTYQNMDDVILNHADSDDSDTELSGEDDEETTRRYDSAYLSNTCGRTTARRRRRAVGRRRRRGPRRRRAVGRRRGRGVRIY